MAFADKFPWSRGSGTLVATLGLAGERILNIAPNGGTRVVDGQQQFRLRGDVLQIAHQCGTVLTGLQVSMDYQILF